MEYIGSPPFPIYLKYDGIFDLDALYRRCVKWFHEYGFEFEETAYKGKADEIELKWAPWMKVNDYIMYKLALNFHILEYKDINVVKDGRKVKLTKARMRVEISMGLETDYSKRFGGNKFAQQIKKFYERFILKKEMEAYYEDQLYYYMHKLYNVMKEFLDTETKTNAFYDNW